MAMSIQHSGLTRQAIMKYCLEPATMAVIRFGDKINLSNTSASESVDAEIAADGENVYVTWWERNENVHPHTNEPVARISNDGGNTFGPILNLATNSTIGNNEE